MSLHLFTHKKGSPEDCNSLRSFSLYGYSVVFACVSTLVNIFQPKRIARVFSLGEYGYFLASVEKTSAIEENLINTAILMKNMI